jgi:hypothetical protein
MNTMTHSFIHILRAATRHCSRTGLVIIALLFSLTLFLQYQSAATSAPAMPTLSGAEAVSYLKEQQLYGSLAEAMNYTLGQQAKLTDSDGRTADRLGYAIAISGDTLIVGAPYDTIGNPSSEPGSVSVFVRSGST